MSATRSWCRPDPCPIGTIGLAQLDLLGLLAACETTQGTSPALGSVQSTQVGQQRIDPAPETKSYKGQKDVFQGAEYDPGVGPLPAGAKRRSWAKSPMRRVYHPLFPRGHPHPGVRAPGRAA